MKHPDLQQPTFAHLFAHPAFPIKVFRSKGGKVHRLSDLEHRTLHEHLGLIVDDTLSGKRDWGIREPGEL